MLRRLLAGIAVAVVLAGCAARHGAVASVSSAATTAASSVPTARAATTAGPSASVAPLRRTPTDAAPVTPSSVTNCHPLSPGGGLGQPLQQSLDGTISGCFQVGRFQPGRATLALVADPQKPLVGSATDPGARITLLPSHGPPGTQITISGDIPNAPPAQVANRQDDHVTVCWAGCAHGLSESATVHWSTATPGHFVTAFQVPATAWIGPGGPQLLQPGPTVVAIACIPPLTDRPKPPPTCDGLQLTTTFQLEA